MESIIGSLKVVQTVVLSMLSEHDKHLARALKRDALTWASRAAEIDNAIISLRLPHTYTISDGVPKLRQMGELAADMLEGLRDEFMENAVQGWLNAKKMADRDNSNKDVVQVATKITLTGESSQHY